MKEEIKKIYLQPGCICISSEPVHICSVVGSGVAVTLYDKKRAFGGMSYYTKPKRETPKQSTPIFACPSIIGMLNIFFEAGSRLEDMEAHIYGGAENSEEEGYIEGLAESNIKTGLELLEKKKIHIAGIDIGGDKGRKIAFNTLSGESVVAKINRIRSKDWYPSVEEQCVL